MAITAAYRFVENDFTANDVSSYRKPRAVFVVADIGDDLVLIHVRKSIATGAIRKAFAKELQ